MLVVSTFFKDFNTSTLSTVKNDQNSSPSLHLSVSLQSNVCSKIENAKEPTFSVEESMNDVCFVFFFVRMKLIFNSSLLSG